jgi:hypothetical protein
MKEIILPLAATLAKWETASSTTQEKYLATAFLMNLDRRCYGGLLVELEHN